MLMSEHGCNVSVKQLFPTTWAPKDTDFAFIFCTSKSSTKNEEEQPKLHTNSLSPSFSFPIQELFVSFARNPRTVAHHVAILFAGVVGFGSRLCGNSPSVHDKIVVAFWTQHWISHRGFSSSSSSGTVPTHPTHPTRSPRSAPRNGKRAKLLGEKE